MSNAFQQYSNATLVVDGSIQLEMGSVTMQATSNTQEVKTIAKGLAGPSLGASQMKLSVTSAVPTAGFEFDPNKDMIKAVIRDFVIFAASQKYTFSGWVDGWKFTKSHDNPSAIDFDVTGNSGVWEDI